MADANSTGCSAQGVYLRDIPTFTIPDTAKRGRHGSVEYTINTGAGPVDVIGWDDKFRFKGNAQSLKAAGIINEDWIVRGRRSYCIVFDSNGPRVRTGERGRPKGEYVHIVVWEQGMYTVHVPTPAQQYREFCRLKIDEQAHGQVAVRNTEDAGVTKYDWLAENIETTSLLLEAISNRLTHDGGEYRYTEASSNRILRCMSELRTAVQEGVAVRKAEERKREGNVIHFPGRSA